MNPGIDFSLEGIKNYILTKLKENEEIFFFNELELQIFGCTNLAEVTLADATHLHY